MNAFLRMTYGSITVKFGALLAGESVVNGPPPGLLRPVNSPLIKALPQETERACPFYAMAYKSFSGRLISCGDMK
jgi:hypothetical protein